MVIAAAMYFLEGSDIKSIDFTSLTLFSSPSQPAARYDDDEKMFIEIKRVVVVKECAQSFKIFSRVFLLMNEIYIKKS